MRFLSIAYILVSAIFVRAQAQQEAWPWIMDGPEITSILLMGDCNFQFRENPEEAFLQVMPTLDAADFQILNLEGPFAVSSKDPNIPDIPHKPWKHSEPDQVVALTAAKIDALEEAGCRYLVHTKVVDTIVENNRVTGVVVATKRGLASITANVVIDCTGDADVSHFAGAETLKDPEQVSPQTLAIRVSHLDSDGTTYKYRMNKEMVRKAKARYPLIPDSWSVSRIASDHSFYINHAGTKVFGHFDITDPFIYTEAECKSRRQVLEMVDAAREFGPPELRNIEISGTGPQIGIRESRRIKGLYILTEEDAIQGSTFEDAIAWRSGAMDIGFTRYSEMKTHDVPYRALLPEYIDGLLVAGRTISATHIGASSGKSMGNCIATGHAAGVAASLSVQDKCQPREVKIGKIQEMLRTHEVDLTRGGKKQSEDAFDSI